MTKLYQNNTKISITNVENSKLFEILDATLPRYIRASKTKDFNHKLLPNRNWALNNAKWLEYNKHTVNYLIIDIDDNRFRTISSLEFYIQCLHLPKPTWILKTDKGYHVSYRLTTPFPTKYKSRIYKWALEIKEAYIDVLEADKHARSIKGVYRNPLLHENAFNDTHYTLDELDIRENKTKSNFKYLKPDIDTDKIASENKRLARMILAGKKFLLPDGMRNSTLFYFGMLIQKKGLDVEAELDKANDRHCLSILDHKELGRIVESVNSYAHKNYVPLRDKNYNEWSKEDKASYMREYRAKNKTTTEEEIMATRSEHMTKLNTKRAEDNYKKVVNIITGLFNDEYKKKSGAWHIQKIADELNLTAKTVSKYIREYQDEK